MASEWRRSARAKLGWNDAFGAILLRLLAVGPS